MCSTDTAFKLNRCTDVPPPPVRAVPGDLKALRCDGLVKPRLSNHNTVCSYDFGSQFSPLVAYGAGVRVECQ
ncbi:unnamed protein product [Echinostoma caproni]|uniref:Lipoprotein n=1 Tax=Echinostoma caproni TaxID=27848 RepID=A0A183BFN5_9TREM|nr:unnamed protein product [Echinostoma caproni]